MHNDVQTARKIPMKTLQKTTKNVVFFFPNPLKIDHGTPKSVRRSNFHLQERFFRSQERFWPSRGVPRRAIFFRLWKTFSNLFKFFQTFSNIFNFFQIILHLNATKGRPISLRFVTYSTQGASRNLNRKRTGSARAPSASATLRAAITVHVSVMSRALRAAARAFGAQSGKKKRLAVLAVTELLGRVARARRFAQRSRFMSA